MRKDKHETLRTFYLRCIIRYHQKGYEQQAIPNWRYVRPDLRNAPTDALQCYVWRIERHIRQKRKERIVFTLQLLALLIIALILFF